MVHKKWLSSVLNMPYSSNGFGIDFLDDRLGIELKCRYDRYTPNFAVHEYQVDHFLEKNPGRELFWAFLVYGLTKTPSDIRGRDIGKFVSSRHVWFLEWDWVRQFPVSYPETGPYRYVHANKDFPPEEEFTRLEEQGGILYLPKGSTLEHKLVVPF